VAGARVIVPARDVHRSAAALTGIDVEIEPMDLLDPPVIDAFAERFLTSRQAVHILVNSAGIMANPLTRDGRGYESQFATNHLGHFQLTICGAPKEIAMPKKMQRWTSPRR
jgi:NAD(P)-dependent dehydrogenase (short-subunit alcohol dehydrogenase family)